MAVLSTPQQLRKDVRGEFIEALMKPQPPMLIDRIATVINSESDKENYAWLGEVAALNEWVDSLEEGDLSETATSGYELENKLYTGALRIMRTDLDDEKTLGLAQRVRDLAQRTLYKPDELLCSALTDGATNTCYDGVAFFSASHTARGAQTAAQSNLLTGAGTSTANCATDIGAGIAALYNYLDEANEPLNGMFSQLYIMYPPALHKAISEAVRAGIISNTTNTQFSQENIDLIRQPRLTSDSVVDYYIGIKDCEVRGLVYQDREGGSMEEEGPGSYAWVEKEQVVYKARMRGIAGYGRWQRCVKINNT